MASLVVRSLEVGIVAVGVLTVYYALTTSTVLCLAALAVLWGVYRLERRRAAGTIPLTGKLVLITGCDTGFGHALAKHLHELDCHVIATVLNPEGPGARKLRDVSSTRMTVLPLDVSSDDSVKQCLTVVKGMCSDSGLWGLVNNAGIPSCVGEVELVTMRQYLHMANVNIFGMVRTTRAFLPLIRQAKGRIVNVTSVQGKIPIPRWSAYSVTKFAGETFSDITRLEMAQFGVKVVIIEPGAFGPSPEARPAHYVRNRGHVEEMLANASEEVKDLYGRQHLDQRVEGAAAQASSSQPSYISSKPVVSAMTEALTSGDPEIRYLVGGKALGRAFSSIDRYPWIIRLKPFVSDRLYHRWALYYFQNWIPKRPRTAQN